MFGYVCINQPELKIKDYEAYRGYYCGLCRNLQKRYGRIGQMLLNYDMTFLTILQCGLYEPQEVEECHRCIPHPVQKHRQILSEATDYAADMNILLSYQKALDDWKDERSISKRILKTVLEKDYQKLKKQYPRQAEQLERSIEVLAKAEQECSEDLDLVAGTTGEFLGEMFVWKEDIWQEDLRTLGFYLGKFVYLIDAFEDMEKDQKKGNYNIFLLRQQKNPDTFDQETENILVDMMTRCARSFERLPILHRSEILRNILYSGVWCRYQAVRAERKKKDEKRAEKETAS